MENPLGGNLTPESGRAAVAARQALVLALELAQQLRLPQRRIGGDFPAVVCRPGGTAACTMKVLLQARLDGRARAARVPVVDELVVLPQREHPRVVRRAGN